MLCNERGGPLELTSSCVQPLRSMAGLRASFHRFAHSVAREAVRQQGPWAAEYDALTATVPGTDPTGDCSPFGAEFVHGAKETLILFCAP